MRESKEEIMSKLQKLLFVALLTIAALTTGVPKASADACSTCASNPSNCFACCRCDGGSFGECLSLCQ